MQHLDLPDHARPFVSDDGRVLAPSLSALFTSLVLMLREQGLVIDTDELYQRAMDSDQGLIEGMSVAH